MYEFQQLEIFHVCRQGNCSTHLLAKTYLQHCWFLCLNWRKFLFFRTRFSPWCTYCISFSIKLVAFPKIIIIIIKSSWSTMTNVRDRSMKSFADTCFPQNKHHQMILWDMFIVIMTIWYSYLLVYDIHVCLFLTLWYNNVKILLSK